MYNEVNVIFKINVMCLINYSHFGDFSICYLVKSIFLDNQLARRIHKQLKGGLAALSRGKG